MAWEIILSQHVWISHNWSCFQLFALLKTTILFLTSPFLVAVTGELWYRTYKVKGYAKITLI